MPSSLRATENVSTRSGAVAIEFALFGTLILLPMLVATIELGFAAYQSMQVYSAVESGALYALRNGWDQAGIEQAVVDGANVSGLTASPAPSQFCGCPTTTGIATTTCVSPPACSNGYKPGQYVQINATLARMSIVADVFGLPATFTAKSIVRLQ